MSRTSRLFKLMDAPLADSERARLPVTHLGNLQRSFSRVRALDAWKLTEPA